MPLCFSNNEPMEGNESGFPEVFTVLEGYCNSTGNDNAWLASGSVTLIKEDTLNVLVDCGSPWDTYKLVEGMKRFNVRPEDVRYVICTHGHIDHIGNLNLFTDSQILLDLDFGMKPGFYGSHNYESGRCFPISENIDVILTPGHTYRDLSVVVRNVPEKGTVVIAGDIFENASDIKNADLWRPNSYNPTQQEHSRRRITEMADWIVPGHGPMFQVSAANAESEEQTSGSK